MIDITSYEERIMGRKPWETPMEYNEDRFDDESGGPGYDDSPANNVMDEHEPDHDPFDDGDDDPFDIDEDDEFDSLDDEPIDYGHGPHDEEFGVDDESEG